MRDPDLMKRAEKAAIALERAWDHWRIIHGLDTNPLSPVSSYVGYSLEEPWGQPRVVFGIGAEDAERLAALLDGHDCVGPVHAGVTGRPDWRRVAPGGAAGAQNWHLDDPLAAVPAQAPRPASETLSPAIWAGEPAMDTAGTASPAGEAAPALDGAPAGEAAADGDPAGETDAAGEAAASRPPAEPGWTVEMPTPAQPGVVVFRKRQEQATGQQPEPVPFAAAPASGGHDAVPSQGPGYRGPRYQGFPPRYQPGPVPEAPGGSVAETPGPESAPGAEQGPEAAGAGQAETGMRRQISRLSRSRRAGAQDAGAWPQDGQAATDTAV